MQSSRPPDGPHGVVVGVDGSHTSRTALDWAARDAELRGVPLTVVHVLAPVATAVWIDVPVPRDFIESRNRRATEIIGESTRAVKASGGVPTRHYVLEGSVVPMLVEMSKGADLLVVGSRGVGEMQGLLHGSVSAGLLHHAHGSIAVIRRDPAQSDPPPSAPVVVGVDGSPASELAVGVAFEEASIRSIGLVAVHTWLDRVGTIPGLDWRNLRIEAEEILAERLAGWAEQCPDVRVERVVVESGPASQLIARSETAQLLVVGSHGRGGLGGLLLGSVGAAVAEGAQCPVIVARPR